MTLHRSRRRAHACGWLLASAATLAPALSAQADAVTDWNATAGDPRVLPRFGGPQFQYRAMAIVQVAVHDALNMIQPRYQTYSNLPAAAAGASPDAAVAAATRRSLLDLFDALAPAPTPAEAANRVAAIALIEGAYATAIGPTVEPAEAAGIAAGELAATSCFMQRHAFDAGLGRFVAIDGAATPNAPAYSLPAAPGVHQPTPNVNSALLTMPAFTGWPRVALFSLDSASQFRAPSSQLFDLSSPFYADQYNQVKHLGDALVRGAFPDSEKSDIPRFWAGGGLDWNATLRLVVAGRDLDRWQHARLFALANMAVSDAGVVNMESKYFYNFWRPITAIRFPDDGNPGTRSDPNWWPFLPTPPYPDYPCASTGVTGAMAQTLRRFFGTNAIGFTRTVNAGPVVLPAPLLPLPPKEITRSYHSLSIAENEQARARVYSGIHFVEGCYVGIKSANQVADWVYSHELRPR